VFTTAANALKKRAPNLYEFVKSTYFHWKLPAVKLLDGKLTFVAPELARAAPSEVHVLRWIADLLRPGDTFFDVGAHYGWMSLVACRRVRTTGKVIAFEPSPPLAKILHYNKAANRFRQMEVVAGAVADSEDQFVPFHLMNQGNSFLNSLVNHTAYLPAGSQIQKSTIQVHTITLDEFCKRRKLQPDLVKIDVEGAELLVLQGARSLLKECRCIFIVATHPSWLPPGQSAADIFSLFSAHGYRLAASHSVKYDETDFGDYVFAPNTKDLVSPLRLDMSR
jgi:FkbM family methyltransferase